MSGSGDLLTITVNPAVDHTVMAPGFHTGGTFRVAGWRRRPGGKGLNVAAVAHTLGLQVTALCLFGGDTGEWLQGQLTAHGVETVAIQCDGESRTNSKIVNPVSGELTELNELGPTVSDDVLDRLRDAVCALAPRHQWMVLTGSLCQGAPDDLYADLCRLARDRDVKVALDASGSALRHGAAAHPTLLKPNAVETQHLLGHKPASPVDAAEAGQKLVAQGVPWVVITLGVQGAVCCTPEGCWYAAPPRLTTGSTVACGDALLAGILSSLTRSDSSADALRLGVACASANAISGPWSIDIDMVDRLERQVDVQPILR